MSNWIEVTEFKDEHPVFMHEKTGQRKIIKPDTPDEQTIRAAYKRALKVLRDEDAAQDFAIEIWKDIAKGKVIRHMGGYLRLRLRKAIARKYNRPDTEILACELSNRADEDMEQDERLAHLASEKAEDHIFHCDYERFTPFQLRIVHLLQRGYSAPTIATLFDVYPRTIYDQINLMKNNQTKA